jgi:hypothetical protein
MNGARLFSLIECHCRNLSKLLEKDPNLDQTHFVNGDIFDENRVSPGFPRGFSLLPKLFRRIAFGLLFRGQSGPSQTFLLPGLLQIY